jgi:hypothetical protein
MAAVLLPRPALAGRGEEAPVNTSLILFVKMAVFVAAVGRGFAADVVILRVLGSSVA